jgi:hypothetical protein
MWKVLGQRDGTVEYRRLYGPSPPNNQAFNVLKNRLRGHQDPAVCTNECGTCGHKEQSSSRDALYELPGLGPALHRSILLLQGFNLYFIRTTWNETSAKIGMISNGALLAAHWVHSVIWANASAGQPSQNGQSGQRTACRPAG